MNNRDKLLSDLRSTLENARNEREGLNALIATLEATLGNYGTAVPAAAAAAPVAAAAAPSSTAAPVKRGPGRPKGSTNKPKAGAVAGAAPAAAAPAGEKKQRGNRNWSPASRTAASERMRKIWEERRKGQAAQA